MKTLNVPNKELPKLKGLALILLRGSELPLGIPAPDKALAESIVLAVQGGQLTEEWVRDGANTALVPRITTVCTEMSEPTPTPSKYEGLGWDHGEIIRPAVRNLRRWLFGG